ncbi:hypothetical protein HISP_03905 [Haloarcula hispanica N601]|uniref:Uncharacterized protein n=4 Tax=Haloarcula TaxID=2237 RepID=A0A482TEU2_HALHI|nr:MULTISPECIES: hypothetical protein [Haloarcula]AEM56377.1 conserved hypothetical protein [Haloarcula hispanica ATCC 33960]AHB65190.1 hypothetical protein HISP_03905 [Haloarcula hispanica N601]KAA9407848.1 hypothetical protein Har1131_13885 [Haloarcula sp. CBA1131]KAA9409105.1 hypothetical protein EGO51_04625 [Haloarcula hispanica]KZX48049.1 hypothetical protein AV929_10115 [Haloarcula sp. K1]
MSDSESRQGETASATIDVSVERPTPGRKFVRHTLLGLVALAGAVFVVTFPSVLPDVGSGTARRLRLGASIGAVVIGLFGLYTVVLTQESDLPPVKGSQPRDPYRDDGTDDEPAELLDELLEPEATQAKSGDMVGDDIDELLAKIDGRVDPYNGLEASYASEVRNRLREAARQVLVETADMSTEAAARDVRTGSWTDDRRAAAFLGGPDAPDPPIEMQLRDWASGEGFDRKVEAAATEIRRLQRGEGA